MIDRRPSRLNLFLGLLIALLPNAVKLAIYRRFFGYEIDSNVRIGFSLLAGVQECSLATGVRIGHLNAFIGVAAVKIERDVRIGSMNLFRGGSQVVIGRNASVLRRNVCNSIPDAESANPRSPLLEIGAGAVITTAHRIDFTDHVVIGHNVIIGGRSSSFWTHNRQRTKPIVIGHHCYIGSDVKVAPGVEVAPLCIVALGAVLMGKFPNEYTLIMGNPAVGSRELTTRDFALLARKTRPDVPDEVAYADISEGVIVEARRLEAEIAEAGEGFRL
jgi:acetyltransferase-like isoleucine patch superfamily enzyme